MDSNFLRYYFEEDLYLHDTPMNMKEFINFCKKRGIKIDKNKLEYLEKNKLFYPIFRVTDNYDSYSAQYVAPDFRQYFHDDLLNDLNSGNIYIPKDKGFTDFKNFYDSKTQSLKTYSYYSSFQICFGYFLRKNTFQIKVQTEGKKNKICFYMKSQGFNYFIFNNFLQQEMYN